MSAFTHALSTNNYGPAKFIVSSSSATGTHTTLTSAMAAASVGDTIFLRDSVTENITITPGVNIACWSGSSLNVPSVTGTLTMTGAGTSTISGLRLVTNSAAIIAVTGSAASILNLNQCYLNCSNNTGITFSSSSSSARIDCNACFGNIGTTGISLFTNTSAGTLTFTACNIRNSGGATTASSSSAGSIQMYSSVFFFPFTTSSSGAYAFENSVVDCSVINATALTTAGTGLSPAYNSYFAGGTASGISIGTGTTVSLQNCVVDSGNTNAITGAGTLIYTEIAMAGTSSGLNTTTLTKRGVLANLFGITTGTAPAAGFVGEQISATGTTVNLPDNVPTNITSINLTAGIWDVSGINQFTPTTFESKTYNLAISANSASLTGTIIGSNSVVASATGSSFTIAIPAFRVSVSATTTYYLVAINDVATGTSTGSGTIRATRVA